MELPLFNPYACFFISKQFWTNTIVIIINKNYKNQEWKDTLKYTHSPNAPFVIFHTSLAFVFFHLDKKSLAVKCTGQQIWYRCTETKTNFPCILSNINHIEKNEML
jgi:hypothetical protein